MSRKPQTMSFVPTNFSLSLRQCPGCPAVHWDTSVYSPSQAPSTAGTTLHVQIMVLGLQDTKELWELVVHNGEPRWGCEGAVIINVHLLAVSLTLWKCNPLPMLKTFCSQSHCKRSRSELGEVANPMWKTQMKWLTDRFNYDLIALVNSSKVDGNRL